MNLLLCVSLVILLLLFLNNKLDTVEGYTTCIKKPSMKFYSVYYTQQYEELSILKNIDLANRAVRANIPVKKIKELIHKDKQKLIMMIMSQEKTLFDSGDVSGDIGDYVIGDDVIGDDVIGDDVIGDQPTRQYEPQYIRGFSDPQKSYSGF